MASGQIATGQMITGQMATGQMITGQMPRPQSAKALVDSVSMYFLLIKQEFSF